MLDSDHRLFRAGAGLADQFTGQDITTEEMPGLFHSLIWREWAGAGGQQQ